MTMKYSFLRKMQNRTINFKISILSIFSSVFILSIVLLIGINYFRLSSDITQSAFQLMQHASLSAFNEVQNEMKDAAIETKVAAELVHKKVIIPTKLLEHLAYTTSLMKEGGYSSVYAVFWADELGNFVITKKQEKGGFVSEITDNMQSPAIKKIIYEDPLKKSVNEVNVKDDKSNPNEHLWYQTVKKNKKTIWTDVYLSKYGKHLRITVATPVYKNGNFYGAFGLDLRLDSLQQFVEQIKLSKHSITFIVTNKGKLIAFPQLNQYRNPYLMDITATSNPSLIESFNYYNKTNKPEFIFSVNSHYYLASYRSLLSVTGNDWLVGTVAPLDDFVGVLKQTNEIMLITGLAILILGISILSTSVTKITQSLKALTQEAEKIKQFNLEDNTQVKSRIKEVRLLSKAIYAMKIGLRSFKKYVPASLVRQLMEIGKDAQIGGEKKQLAVLFTDIKNFTTISEQVEPNQLVEQMCEYCDELSSIIHNSSGTIDKYIGDSIMVFWGAPLPVAEPCQKAARAALKIQHNLIKMNKQWRSLDKPPFITRIGIHFGEVIVGNLGSSEHLNYTVIGDTVNSASRFEGLNKIYGTKILVSNTVYDLLKNQFILRYVDSIIVKGKTQSNFIYELMAENSDELSFDFNSYQALFKEAHDLYQKQHWDSAISYFERCIEIFPEDTVAPVFISRCHYFKSHNPPVDWNGIWQMAEK